MEKIFRETANPQAERVLARRQKEELGMRPLEEQVEMLRGDAKIMVTYADLVRDVGGLLDRYGTARAIPENQLADVGEEHDELPGMILAVALELEEQAKQKRGSVQ